MYSIDLYFLIFENVLENLGEFETVHTKLNIFILAAIFYYLQ